MRGRRDRHERENGGAQQCRQQQIARTVQHCRPVGEDERGEDVERSLLRHPRQCGQDDLFWLPSEHLEDRRTRHPLLSDDALENRGLGDAEANVEADADHDDAHAQPERYAHP